MCVSEVFLTSCVLAMCFTVLTYVYQMTMYRCVCTHTHKYIHIQMLEHNSREHEGWTWPQLISCSGHTEAEEAGHVTHLCGILVHVILPHSKYGG